MQGAEYVGRFRVTALVFVASLTMACAGCGAPTGGSGGEGQNPGPIETGGTENPENAASGGAMTTGSGEGSPSTRVGVSTLAAGLRGRGHRLYPLAAARHRQAGASRRRPR